MSNHWRDHARPIIAEVIAGFPADADEKAIRKALTHAYPYGERAMWPYKVWCDEVRRQLMARRKREHLPQEPFDALPLFGATA